MSPTEIAGKAAKSTLVANIYSSEPKKVIEVFDIRPLADAEVEDLIPFNLIEPAINRIFREAETVFSDNYDPEKPIVDQIEKFAKDNSIDLEEGWKVILAKQCKTRLIAKTSPDIDKAVIQYWKKLFGNFKAS